VSLEKFLFVLCCAKNKKDRFLLVERSSKLNLCGLGRYLFSGTNFRLIIRQAKINWKPLLTGRHGRAR